MNCNNTSWQVPQNTWHSPQTVHLPPRPPPPAMETSILKSNYLILYIMWNLTTHKNAKKYTHNTYKMQLHICVWVLKWWEISLYVSTTGFVVIRTWSYGLKLYNLLENGLVWRDWNKTSQTTDKTDTPIKKEISRTVVIMRQVIAVLMVFCVVIPCRLVGGYQCFKRK
jgi:hypothetical protein